MRTLSKNQATSLVLDSIKTTCKKTNETYSSLIKRGYVPINEIAQLNVPTHYLFSQQEGRLFYCKSFTCTEITKATVKRKKFQVF